MPKEFIVAIELGSSKMTGIAGQKNLDGSITVLAVVTEDSTSCIRKGVVYNIDKTGQCLIPAQKQGAAAQQGTLGRGKLRHRGHLQTVLFETE